MWRAWPSIFTGVKETDRGVGDIQAVKTPERAVEPSLCASGRAASLAIAAAAQETLFPFSARLTVLASSDMFSGFMQNASMPARAASAALILLLL